MLRTGLLMLVGAIAIAASVIYADVADARCGGGAGSRQGFFARRRANRMGGGGTSMSYSETHSMQMRGSGMMFRGAGTRGAGGCN